MRRALQLAQRGAGLASPNPMVGAVLVRNGRIVGEGFHRYADRDHAEVVALRKAGSAARGSTLYINLEPCCHTGRTGPCSDALIAAGVKRVVAAMPDPNPQVCGKSVKQLRRAGLRVDVGLLRSEAERLNEAFSKWITTGLPFVTLKSALTLDGQLALSVGAAPRGRPYRGANLQSSTWFTSEESRAAVHRIRHAADALITGVGTVLADNPQMTDRSGLPRRRPLLRAILDSRLRLPVHSKIVRAAKNDLIVFTLASETSSRARALRRAGAEVVRVGQALLPVRGSSKKTGQARVPLLRRVDLRAVIRELGRRGITSAVLEGGAQLNAAALATGVVDKLILFYAPKLAGRVTVPFAAGLNRPPAADGLRDVTVRTFAHDVCIEGYLK